MWQKMKKQKWKKYVDIQLFRWSHIQFKDRVKHGEFLGAGDPEKATEYQKTQFEKIGGVGNKSFQKHLINSVTTPRHKTVKKL